jgi:ribosomal protein S18 acetylase RimI-like enzyme
MMNHEYPRNVGAYRIGVAEVDTSPLAAAVKDPRLLEGMLDVYRSAFAGPPWDESEEDVDRYRARLLEDRARPDAALATARLADGTLVGFGTSWTFTESDPIRPWHRTMSTVIPPNVLHDRVIGRIEVDELAVHRDWQGRGIGRHLLGAVAPIDGPPAWLLTSRSAQAAVRLYRSAGWEELSARSPDGSEFLLFLTPRTMYPA